jgi:hypothetical protein
VYTVFVVDDTVSAPEAPAQCCNTHKWK